MKNALTRAIVASSLLLLAALIGSVILAKRHVKEG